MLKKKSWILFPALTLFLLLAPIPSHAAPTGSPLFGAGVPAGLFDKLAQWLDVLAGDAKARTPRTPRTPRAPAHSVTIPQKHGCGIDPQGQPYCTPD
jgi:hypothetical protein